MDAGEYKHISLRVFVAVTLFLNPQLYPQSSVHFGKLPGFPGVYDITVPHLTMFIPGDWLTKPKHWYMGHILRYSQNPSHP